MNYTSTTMNDKECLNDGLISQKQITSSYNTFAGECVNTQVRDEFLCILKEEHEIQSNLFCNLQSHGWVAPAAAEQQKIDQARQKYPTK
ncbi:MAG: spore coat protein [Oscillospiraceae bacterium]|nr:spore coat protein [Oscillospiraceae bacterium]